MSAPASSSKGGVLQGFGIGLGVTFFFASVVFFFEGILALVAIGIVEWVWLLPMYFWFRRKGVTDTAKGILLAGSMIFMLSAMGLGLGIVGSLFG